MDTLRTADSESVYRLCQTGRDHHHLVCRVCRRAVEIEAVEVERWTSQVARAEGFTDVERVVEVTPTRARQAPAGSLRDLTPVG